MFGPASAPQGGVGDVCGSHVPAKIGEMEFRRHENFKRGQEMGIDSPWI